MPIQTFQSSPSGRAFVQSPTGQARNGGYPYFDGVTVRVCAPIPAIGYGFDLTTPSVWSGPFSGGSVTWYDWSVPTLSNPTNLPLDFYMTKTVVETFTSWIGSTDSSNVFTGYLLTVIITTVYKNYLWYRNPNDLEQTYHDNNLASTQYLRGAASVNGTALSDDLRLTGFPVNFDSTTDYFFTYSGGGTWTITDGPNQVTFAAGNNTTTGQNPNGINDSAHMPAFSSDGSQVVQYYPGTNPIYTPSTTYTCQLGLASRVTTFSDKLTWTAYVAHLNALYASATIGVSLPCGPIPTREGNFYLDMFGVKSAYPQFPVTTLGANYNNDGTVTLTALPPGQTFAFMLGPNDNGGLTGEGSDSPPSGYNILMPKDATGTPASAMTGQDVSWGFNQYCYKFPTSGDFTDLFTSIYLVGVDNGESLNVGGGTTTSPSGSAFEASGSSVTFYGGSFWTLTPWAATTAHAVGDIVTNIPTFVSGKMIVNSHIKAQVTAIAGGAASGNSGGTEPAWPAAGNTITDGDLTWTILLDKVPVGIIVSLPHANVFTVFETRGHTTSGGGPIVTIEAFAPYCLSARAFSNTSMSTLPGSDSAWGILGLVWMWDAIRIPTVIDASYPDPAQFGRIGGSDYTETLNVVAYEWNDTATANTVGEVKTLKTGKEYRFYPTDVPANYGFVAFGDISLVNSSPQAAGDGSAGSQQGIGGQQNSPGLL